MRPSGWLRRAASIPIACGLLAACAVPAPPTATPAPAGPPPAASPAPPADPTPLPAQADALAAAMRDAPIVVLGEVHDNAWQHALRARAIALRLAQGARPAIAFEQFDRERQADIDRSRRERPRDADALIARAGGPGWDWRLYRPFVQLALDHDLPIVAANLSRGDASRVVREGFAAVLDADTRAALALDAPPPGLLDAQVREVREGHCGLLPEHLLVPMARAQVARDVVLARSIAPHAARGVVLLTGNGHARRDIGVVRWLPTAQQAATRAIGLLEAPSSAAVPAAAFDVVVVTPAPAREDPCAGVRRPTARPPAS